MIGQIGVIYNGCGGLRTRRVVARAEKAASSKTESKSTPAAPVEPTPVQTTAPPPAQTSSDVPEWVPEPAIPFVKFLGADDFKLESWEPYTKYAKKYVDDDIFTQSIGWKPLPEIINGRLAMIGMLGAVFAELFRGFSVFKQLGAQYGPLIVVLNLALWTAASIIPVVKKADDKLVAELLDQYTLPEATFTPMNEKMLGRLAMIGFGGLACIEILKGSALL